MSLMPEAIALSKEVADASAGGMCCSTKPRSCIFHIRPFWSYIYTQYSALSVHAQVMLIQMRLGGLIYWKSDACSPDRSVRQTHGVSIGRRRAREPSRSALHPAGTT